MASLLWQQHISIHTPHSGLTQPRNKVPVSLAAIDNVCMESQGLGYTSLEFFCKSSSSFECRHSLKLLVPSSVPNQCPPMTVTLTLRAALQHASAIDIIAWHATLPILARCMGMAQLRDGTISKCFKCHKNDLQWSDLSQSGRKKASVQQKVQNSVSKVFIVHIIE